MTGGAQGRAVGLAMVALVVLLAALATERRVDPPRRGPAVVLPESGRWEVAQAVRLAGGVLPAGCGLEVGKLTLAVSHPVLPCGTRIVLDAGGASASVQVAGRAATLGDAAFGLTPELARLLRVTGAPQAVRWALAAG